MTLSARAPLFVEGEKFFQAPPDLAPLGQPPLGRGGLWADEGIGPYKVQKKIAEAGGRGRPPLQDVTYP